MPSYSKISSRCKTCRSIGIGGRRALDVHYSGLRALDLYRVCQIADRLEVSVDWLLGRSDVMEILREREADRLGTQYACTAQMFVSTPVKKSPSVLENYAGGDYIRLS